MSRPTCIICGFDSGGTYFCDFHQKQYPRAVALQSKYDALAAEVDALRAELDHVKAESLRVVKVGAERLSVQLVKREQTL